jgi:putative transposase
MAAYLISVYLISITRACLVIGLPKSMFYYKPCKDDGEVIEKLQQLAENKPNEGQDKFYYRIRLQGIKWNYKRIRRVYKMLGLNIRRKMKRRFPARVKEPLHQAEETNKVWSMDFMSDSLISKRKFRVLNIMDDFNRRAVHIEADFSLPTSRVVQALKIAIHEYGKPEKIRVDNGPEFTSSDFTDWCQREQITVQYIQPGRPMQNGFIERFNRSYRQDVLNAYLFEDLNQLKIITEEWIDDYNNHRPHESLGGVPPEKYITHAC